MLQIANLVLIDEIKRIDAENKFIKSKFDVLSFSDLILLRMREAQTLTEGLTRQIRPSSSITSQGILSTQRETSREKASTRGN